MGAINIIYLHLAVATDIFESLAKANDAWTSLSGLFIGVTS